MRNCYKFFTVKSFLLVLFTVVIANIANAQYCTTGLYTTGCTSNDYINSFSTTGGATNITNNNTACSNTGSVNAYTYYAGQNHTTVQGTVVNFSYTNCPGFGEGYKIWIDYDNNGSFEDAGELVYNPTAVTTAGSTATGSFTVPMTVTPGLKRMRVRCVYATVTFASCTSHTWGEVEEYDFTVVAAVACSGTPTAGTATATSTNILCPGATTTLGLAGSSLSSGLTYQWQSSTNNTTFTNITGATAFNYTTTQTLPVVYYRCIVTCTNGGATSTSTSILVNSVGGPVYATLPFVESFEPTWINACGTRDVPNQYWKTTPLTGNTAWRRNDDGVAGGGWTGNLGVYTPAASDGTYSARFHSYNATSGTSGTLDLYLNCNTPATNKRLVFDFINTSGTDSLSILISTNGGTSFTRIDSGGVAATWRTKTIFFNSTSATTVIRFQGTSDFGTTDIGVDNVRLNNWADCSGTPVAGTATANPTSGACANTPVALAVTGATDGNGISYQWQLSTNGGTTWVDIAGAANFTATVFQSVTTQYRCVVKCNISNQTANSLPVTVVSPALPGGTYTIDNSLPTLWSGSSGNFNSFNDAYNAIKCGIVSSVIFNVQNGTTSGVYTEQLIMTAVPGTSATKTVTFNGNGKTLTYASSNANERAVIKLKGAKYIIFDSLNITATGTYGFGVHLTADADSNIVRKCTITTSTTSATAANYAGVVISGSDTDPIGVGTTTALCDANKILNNKIIGGYYGITLTATFAGGANGNNVFSGNDVQDFYMYGMYVNASYNTLIEKNKFSRPTRTAVGDFQGIYFTTQSNTATISKNRFFNPFGGALSNTSLTFYGINFNSSSASTGNDNTVVNNLVYNVNANGPVYGFINTSSSNVSYFHNTISLDEISSTATGLTRGFHQTGTAGGIFFYNNIVSITRGGTGTKHCMYLATAALGSADNNNYYIVPSATSFVGFLTSNKSTIADWKIASLPASSEQASISIIPVYTDPSPAVADFHPNNAGMDNKGLYLGIDDDIVALNIRSNTTPDIGAYEFVPSPCTLPIAPGTTQISATTICQAQQVILGLAIGAFGSTQSFQWQYSTSATGPWTNLGNPLPTPDTIILASQTYYYQCLVKCGVASATSNAVLLNVTPALAAGTYTINSAQATTYTGPSTGTNFTSFADAKAAMSCGVVGTGNIIFNVLTGANAGVYTEQLILDSIKGANVNRQIIFNGNGNKLAFSSNNNSERAVIKLNAADYITFDSLVIDATGAGAYGYGVQLINNADSNTIRKCTILANGTATNTNYAGIVVNAAATNATTTGATLCDANTFDKNTIKGGYYGATLIGSASPQLIVNNKFTNNIVQDFYTYGVFVAGTGSTLIEGNTFSRPTRTVVTTAFPIYVTTLASPGLKISKNRITLMYGGAPTNTAGIYGIYHNSVDVAAGGENIVSNNLLYNLDGAGFIYGMYNVGSDNVFYYHNTISIDNATSAVGTSVGFYQTTDVVGVQFKNNIVTIRRAGAGTKQGIYLGSTTTDVTSNYNNILVTGTGANVYTGYYGGTNYATLAAWKTATIKDTNSVALDPLYIDTLNANYKPQMAPLDNKGTPVGITNDILNAIRNLTKPDIGAYEFAPLPCATPPVAGTASVTPNTGVCLEVPIRLSLTGHSPLGNITFQWQASTSAAGPWTNFGPLQYSPVFDSLTSSTNYYRCAVTCNTTTTYSNVVNVALNAIVLAGTYTIDGSLPATWVSSGGAVGTNFQTVQSAVSALLCGMTGSVVFNVKGTFNEQVRIPYVPGTLPTSTVTFQSYNGLPTGAEITFNSTNTAKNYTLQLDSTKYFTFKNLTLSATNTTNGRVLDFANTASFNNVLNCVVNTPVVATTANTSAAIFASALKGTGLVIKGNTINNGSAGIYISGTNTTNQTVNHLIDSNLVSGAYFFGIYTNATKQTNVNRNTVTIPTTSFGTVYGLFINDSDSSYQVKNNTVIANGLAVTAYGIYLNACDGSIINRGVVSGNDIVTTTANTGAFYGIYSTTSPYMDVLNNTAVVNTTNNLGYGIYNQNAGNVNYYNNSVNVLSSPLTQVALYVNNTSTNNIIVKNNILSNKGGGKAYFVYNSASASSDYNMFYTSGAALMQRTLPTGTNYATIDVWRTASLQDNFSIVYAPAFVSDVNLKPDLANVDVWAIHGRGVQITENTYDHDNKARPITLLTGVPDLGAYEFYPTALPTALTATPATPAPNVEQTFMYGTDTVMKIKWGATAPSSVAVRRYSGVVPTGLAAGGLDSMYFYTKVDIPGGGNYDYDAKLFYIDSWLGSIAGLTSGVYQLGLGKTTPGGAWIVGFTSRNNVPKRMIYQTNVNYLDKFTGLINPYAPPVLPDKDSSNRGRRFWVAYAANQLAGSQDMVIYLSAQEAANVQIKINGTTWVRNYTVPTNTVISSDIIPKAGADNAFLNTAGKFDQGISITSDVPIVAYAHVYGSASSGAVMLLPVGVWGYEYKTLAITGTGTYSDARHLFYVIADNDNTKIEITPSGAVQNTGMAANTVTAITLNKGQVFQVLSTTSTGDLTGSTVKAVPNSAGKCFPIAVFSGHSRLNLAPSGCTTSGGDFMMQQNFPSTAWGKRYLLAPSSFSGAAAAPYALNVYRVAVKNPATIVKRDGTVMTGIINNHYYEFTANTATYIEADQPIMIAQFLADGSCSGGSGVGDPEMFYVSPIEQGINKVGFYRNTLQSISTNYLTMIVPTNGLPSLQIVDGATPVTPDVTYAHPANGQASLKGVNYSVVIKRFTSAQQQVRVQCDSAFTGITYGLGSVESYGYNVGTLVKNLQALGAINNTLNPSGNSTEYTCAGAPFQFTMLLPVIPTSITWKFSQVPFLTPNADVTVNSPVPTGTVVINGTVYYKFTLTQTYIFSNPGLYPVQVTYTHPTIESCDNTQTDIIYVQVIPSPAIGFNIAFAGCQNQTATFTADNTTPSGINVNQWAWTFNNGTTATGQTTTFTYPNAGTFTESLHVVTADGCVRDTARQVVVNPLPIITVVSDSINVCNAASATFTIQAPLAGATYNWYTTATGGTPIFTGTAYTLTNITTTTVLYIEAISAAGCTSAARKRVVVKVYNPLPTPVVTVASSTATSVTFSWTPVSGAASYLVSVNGGAFGVPSSGSTGTTHTVTGLGILTSANIIVQAIGTITCQTSNSPQVSGCTNSAPVVTTDSVAICVGNSYTFNVDAPLPANVTYTWYNAPTGGTALTTGGAYTINTSGSSFGVNNISPAGIYNYYSNGANTTSGCVGTIRKKVVLNVLAPLAKPVVTVVQTAATPTSITFSWVAVSGALNYQVSIDNGATWNLPSSGSTGTTHTVTGLQPNTAVTILVRANGIIACQQSVSDAVTGKTLIDQIFVPTAFNPNSTNPANRTLRVYGYVISSMQMMIFNQWGEKVFESNDQNIGWDGTYKGKQQPSGVYIYVLKMTLYNGTTSEMKGSINLIR